MKNSLLIFIASCFSISLQTVHAQKTTPPRSPIVKRPTQPPPFNPTDIIINLKNKVKELPVPNQDGLVEVQQMNNSYKIYVDYKNKVAYDIIVKDDKGTIVPTNSYKLKSGGKEVTCWKRFTAKDGSIHWIKIDCPDFGKWN